MDMNNTTNFTADGDSNSLLDGTSPLDVYYVAFYIPLCSLIISVSTVTSNLSFKTVAVIETIFINLVSLLAVTLFSNHLLHFLLTLCAILCATVAYVYSQLSNDHLHRIRKSISEIHPLDDFNRKFMGDYRGHLLLLTSVCILAVDFAIFPESFSKTETYGWSLMDTGVGSFVLVHGLFSSDARKSTAQQESLKKCLSSACPLFILGLIRLALTTAVGYHKVVPEYGVHWNFFFTLAITKVLCYFIATCFPFIWSGLLALMILIVHQTLLSKSLTTFILSDSRRNLIEANKEGICSLLGFVSIYFFGVQLGKFLWKKRYKLSEFVYLFFKIVILGVLGWNLMYIIHLNIQPVSRRMANSAYCIWVVTLTGLQIAIHLAHQIINFLIHQGLKKDVNNCLLWNAINYNALFYFLIANVMTGLVNLTITTKNYDIWPSFLILVLYLTALTIPVIILHHKSLKLKT